MPLDLTDDERGAAARLLAPDPIERDDLMAAFRASLRRRRQNSRDGGLVLAALHRNGLSWRELEAAFDVPESTLRTWIDPPKGRRP